MTVEFILDISRNDDLQCQLEGLDEVELRADVDLGYDDEADIISIDIYTSTGWIPASGEVFEQLKTLLEYSGPFNLAIMEQAKEEKADNELERRLNSLELESCFSN